MEVHLSYTSWFHEGDAHHVGYAPCHPRYVHHDFHDFDRQSRMPVHPYGPADADVTVTWVVENQPSHLANHDVLLSVPYAALGKRLDMALFLSTDIQATRDHLTYRYHTRMAFDS